MLKVLEAVGYSQGTLLFYESPHRVQKTLAIMLESYGDRSIVLARELTKRHEEYVRGSIQECMDWLEEHPPLGEYCVIVEGMSKEEEHTLQNEWWQSLKLSEHVEHYENEGLSRKDAMKKTATDRGLSKRDIYNALLKNEENER